MKNINRIKSLIKEECAGYVTGFVNNYCCNHDEACLYFGEGDMLRCKYFEEGVLPLEEDLERQYRQEHNMGAAVGRKAKPKVKCERCGELFDANSNRQHYCEKCQKIVRREQSRERQYRLRVNSA
ncbi:MAG: hypothetical protein PHE79_01960 [Eubacteriales bacterium]|nr:hypothetical protein [Eubacteriales bacterium]